VIVVDYEDAYTYDQRHDIVETLRPLHKALRQMKHVWRMMQMTDAGTRPYRWTDEDMDKVNEVLDQLRDRFREMEAANREEP
jgi:uncharacterized protein Yka (UPF0111/DUF47 family)